MISLESRQKVSDLPSLNQLFKQYSAEDMLMEQLDRLTLPKVVARPIQTIGIFYPRVFQGGVERVISLQIPIFLKMGYRVVLFTAEIDIKKEYPIDSSVVRVTLPRNFEDGRVDAFASALRENKVDVLIHHDSSGSTILQDLILLKTLGIHTVVLRHQLTVQDMGNLNERVARYHRIYRLADKVIVLSSMEETFYQLMGCHAKYLPNPIQFEHQPEEDISRRKLILWIGRLERRQKNYHDALEIMQLVVKKHPEALLIMLGAEDRPGAAREIRRFIRENHLEQNIQWHDHILNIASYYRQARIHLVTSSYESFSMTIIESKSYGIPLVTYSMPYLELLKSGKGYIAVRQRDIERAAKVIIQLLEDDGLCERLSAEARRSVIPFLEFDQEKAWAEMLSSLGKESFAVSAGDLTSERKDIKVFIETLFEHYEKGCIANKKDSSSIGNKFNYFKYSLLSKITSGKRQERYHNKSIEYRNKG